MKKTILMLLLSVPIFAIGITNANAASFGSDCKFVVTQPSEFRFHFELVNKNTNQRDALCRVVTNRVENYGSSTAKIIEMTEYSLDVSVTDGDNFTVYVEKDGEAINQYLKFPIVTDSNNDTSVNNSPTSSESTTTSENQCMNSVIDTNGRYSIELLGLDGKRNANCRFFEYNYDVLSGTAKLIEMNEYTLFFDGTKKGKVKVTTTSPSYYWAEFEIGNSSTVSPSTEITTSESSTTGKRIPPAGYEDKVITAFVNYENPFPDTNTSSLEGKAAAELYRRAVIGGYPDGEFKGAREVNRAEAAKFLLYARYGTVADIKNSGKFQDVLDGQWYTKFVIEAANKGIISGYPDGLFRPQNTVNTAEFLKMLTLTFGLSENLSYSYTDVKSSDWFSKYAGIAEKYNLFPERSTYLNPGKNLTRKEVAVAIYQYLSNR